MTPLEEKQRRNRFYFYMIFWLISMVIFLYIGYEFGRATEKSNKEKMIYTTEIILTNSN